MPLLQLVLIAVIQGITEFLPISSSGHLILLPALSGYEDQGQAIDVAVHVGTLLAVILYFWSDAKQVFVGVPKLMLGQFSTPEARLALLLAIASVPVIAFGLILELTGLDEALRSIAVIGWAMLIFGLFLYWSDQVGDSHKTDKDWSLQDAMIIGIWQAVALIPGTSRSGITITGARFLGYGRHDAAKLAMLMSIPTILASGAYLAGESMAEADPTVWRDGAIAALFAFLAALASLAVMMRLLRRVSFTPYVIYRVVLGLVLLWIAYT
ncbi:MAG: undecaprenyl-diphosphate phosphatase [Pseudomonadota bacterium]